MLAWSGKRATRSKNATRSKDIPTIGTRTLDMEMKLKETFSEDVILQPIWCEPASAKSPNWAALAVRGPPCLPIGPPYSPARRLITTLCPLLPSDQAAVHDGVHDC